VTAAEVNERRSVVVTGASTGIGRAAVTALAGAGFRIFPTVRKPTDADSLRQQFGQQVTPLIVDLLDETSVRAAGATVTDAGPLFGLVNNAGAALSGPLEFLPIDTFRRQLEINLTAQLLMTQVMLPALRRSAERDRDARIVMIGSIGGRIAGPILGAYQAAKHGLVGLTGSLRAELAPFDIKVILLEPGAIATPIWQRGLAAGDEIVAGRREDFARYRPQMEAARRLAERASHQGIPPEVPARKIVDALTSEHPAPRAVIGRDAHVVAAMVRVLPFRLLYRLLAARRPSQAS
jgi:NAD(P)-dependent dehydrogenase (short-subunit alcohol dehydrogenase family)